MAKRSPSRLRAVAAWSLLLAATSREAQAQHALALEGVDEVGALAPAAAHIEPYENAGYRLWLEGDTVRVRVDNAHLESEASFEPRPADPTDRVQALAASLTSQSTTRYDATSAILNWVARNIRYDLDRSASQGAKSVLERRSGYCTGIARLSVELLRSLGIEAREVAGYVLGDGPGDVRGYHRWIEVDYGASDWAFSDPISSHHFVPATYVRLASDELDLSQPGDALVLSRHHNLHARDVYPGPPARVRARKNTDHQVAGAIRVRVEGRVRGLVQLHHGATTHRTTLDGGSATFTGLEPGDYRLEVRLEDGRVLSRALRLKKRIRADISMNAALRGAPSAG